MIFARIFSDVHFVFDEGFMIRDPYYNTPLYADSLITSCNNDTGLLFHFSIHISQKRERYFETEKHTWNEENILTSGSSIENMIYGE